jgi:dTDP-4-dehydrorhamnose reductase
MLYLATTEGKTNFDVVDEEVSSPTYAPDVARFTKGLVVSGQEFGVYHGANTGACSWYEWAKEIFKQKGLAVTINAVPGGVYPRPAKRPLYSHLINTKLPGQRTWQAALKDFLASY